MQKLCDPTYEKYLSQQKIKASGLSKMLSPWQS